MQTQLDAMSAILKQIKCDKEQAASQQSLQMLKQQMANTIQKIKVSDKLTEKEVDHFYNELFNACDRDLKKLKQLLEQQKNKDEQLRLKKIQVNFLNSNR